MLDRVCRELVHVFLALEMIANQNNMLNLSHANLHTCSCDNMSFVNKFVKEGRFMLLGKH